MTKEKKNNLPCPLRGLTHNAIDRLSEVIDIVRIQTSHRDTAVLSLNQS